MGDEWDLHAVVRSCTAVTAAAATTTTTTVDQVDDPFLNLASLDSQNHYTPFLSPDFAENQSYKWEGLLEEIYKESCAPPQPLIVTTSSATLIPISEGFQNVQPPLEDIQNVSVSFPASTSRSRKRKNQPKKTVKQMTQEELTDDLWAWRKYGQKPIKGSPYPRNYYRCSTSKGCGARKQVERSPTDPAIFVVSYTGEHTHPRPIHRSSLAGSSRTKFCATLNKPISGGTAPSTAVVSKPSCSSSSPASFSSFSPTTPLMEDESDIHDDDILIPNVVMSGEIFKGFQELNGGKVGLGGATPDFLSSPWTPTKSATTSFNGGGGDC